MEKELTDSIWELLNNLADEDGPDLVNAVIYLVDEFDFDTDILPIKLRRKVRDEIGRRYMWGRYD